MMLIEIRTYVLKVGMGQIFHDLETQSAIPLHTAWGIRVLFHGPSALDPDTYLLIRAFDDEAQMDAQLQAFYDSDDWRADLRQKIIDCIDRDLVTYVCSAENDLTHWQTFLSNA